MPLSLGPAGGTPWGHRAGDQKQSTRLGPGLPYDCTLLKDRGLLGPSPPWQLEAAWARIRARETCVPLSCSYRLS